MRILLNLFIFAALFPAHALADCPSGDFTLDVTGDCSYSTVSTAFSAGYSGCDLSNFLEIASDEITEYIGAMCESAVKDATIPFHSITEKFYQYDKNYFDGGTKWNNEKETEEAILVIDAGRITRFAANSADEAIVGWPNGQYIDNFNEDSSCDLQVAMCCFIDRRSESPLPDNTDVCYHDVANSRTSSHVRNGFNIYAGEESTNCNGFSWSDSDLSDRYKGNILFHISMNQLYTDGYVKNIPGAPMCACIEKMPKVTHSDCTEATVVETYTFSYSTNSTYLEASLFSDVTFGTCAGNSLTAYYETVASQENINELSNHIVNDCETSTNEFLTSMFYIPGQSPTYVDPAMWEKIVGEGFLYSPSPGDDFFRAMVGETPPYKVIRRVCLDCFHSHKNIYYERITPVPVDLDFLDFFMNNWNDAPNNTLNVDFELYSSHQDFIDGTNKWTYCNYNDPGIGFPRDCGPSGYVSNQWNSYTRGGGYGNNHGYYVEK